MKTYKVEEEKSECGEMLVSENYNYVILGFRSE